MVNPRVMAAWVGKYKERVFGEDAEYENLLYWKKR